MRNAILPMAPAAYQLPAQVTADQLQHAAEGPRNWLTYFSRRYSALTQITPTNTKNPEQKWIFQADSLQRFEATPLVTARTSAFMRVTILSVRETALRLPIKQ